MLGLALITACTELADPAESGRVQLSPEPGVSLAADDGGSPRQPDDLAADDDRLDHDRANTDAGADMDSTPPTGLDDAGSSDDSEPSTSGDAGPSTPGSVAPCPSGLRFGDSCYRSSLVPLAWDDARQDCLAGGADLVAIDSAGEDAFVAGLLSVNVWLGASDRELEGAFLWTDGRALSFANWGSNQPDAFPGQNCVEKRAEAGASWYDQSCDNLAFYVCERPLE